MYSAVCCAAGLTAERAGEIVYTMCGQANYEALVTQCGWTRQEYQGWLADTLVAALLPGETAVPLG